MRVYWRKVRWGQNLILSDEEGHEQEVGGFRETKRGIDALAKTFGYDPSHSRKGFQTIEEAKAFVESFKPWELYGAQDITVESEVMPALDSASAGTTVTLEQRAKSMVPEVQPRKRWWEFWKKT
jgi:hypothetical protein